MDTFLILMMFFGSKSSVAVDGDLLAYQLKIIKEIIGVNALQKQFDQFPYVPKTDTGNEILKRIQSNLDTTLENLDRVLNNVKNKLVAVNKDSDTTDLPNCCDLSDNGLTYALKFQTKVDFKQACITTSSIKTDNLKYPTDDISDIMKKDYQDNRNVLWQHYSTTEGVFVLYPATKCKDCQHFDPRFTTPYASTASPTDKDVVIVIDTSESMLQQSGVVPSKRKISIAREAANNVIQTLKPNDRVGVVTFNQDAISPSGCYHSELAFATKENTDTLIGFVFSVNVGQSDLKNFEKSLVAAFRFFNSSNHSVKVENRDRVILFITDGKSTSGIDPVQVISTENSKLQNKISIFTYLIGQDEQAKVQLHNMSKQTLYDPSSGPTERGHFEHFDTSTLKLFSVKLATFYDNLIALDQSDQTFTSPYVDPYSEIGLITSLCRTVKLAAGFHGVMCTDVKISDLLSEIEYFSEEEYSYGFMIAGTGRVLMHPLLPNAAFVKSNEDPVFVDISVLERASEAKLVIESMKSGGNGVEEFNKMFTKPRGKLVNDGSKNITLKAHFHWGPVPRSNFSLCIVLVDESYSEIDEKQFQPSSTDLQNVFMFHNRSLSRDNFETCKFYRRRATIAHSSVKFTQSAFKNPFQFIDSDETAENVTKYENYIKTKGSNPGFKSTVRSSVWATYKAEQFWKQNPVSFVSWRYIGTKSGIMRTYPGILMHKNFDHEKRPWWRQALGQPKTMYITTPYVDGWGSGIVLTFIHTLHKKGSDAVTATIAADFPLLYCYWFLNEIYPDCNDGNSCIILDNSGFIVMHPDFKQSTVESDFHEPKHITVKEHGIAELLKARGVLNPVQCQDFSVNTNLQSYRVFLPRQFSSGLDFEDTNDEFEMRPVADSNLFIIRFHSTSTPSGTCSCDGSKSPDVVKCKESCQCLCHKPIIYDICSNSYKTESASSPCSARIPDTSGTNEPDDTDGLKACYVPTCYKKTNKQDCYSEAECTWCEYTDIGQQIATPCCRLKEDCYFGKTKPDKRDTCEATPNQSKGIDSNEIIGIVIGSVVAVIILGLVVFGAVKYFKMFDRTNEIDPYIDAIGDYELPQKTEKQESSGSELKGKDNQNFYDSSH
ncbi:VWFA and cache domain-containing protein 1-like isoform X1 [Mytilus edulis]|uniref:VWFA and cache domain-containing protein 1-like isoform X1 n=1 Tax=Mytilus edulis TaxID=6550 RepID=UPI0039EE3F3E